jgi:hypothetical protein
MDAEDKMKWPSHPEDDYYVDDDYDVDYNDDDDYYDEDPDDYWDEMEQKEMNEDAEREAEWERLDKQEDKDLKKYADNYNKATAELWIKLAECLSDGSFTGSLNPSTPSYYSKFSHQPIDCMKERFTKEELAGFYKGNLVKYCLRLGEKEDEIKTLQKIINYATWLKQLKEEMRGANNEFSHAD